MPSNTANPKCSVCNDTGTAVKVICTAKTIKYKTIRCPACKIPKKDRKPVDIRDVLKVD